MAYLVLVPSPGISSSASTISKALANYFRNLSITFKVCRYYRLLNLCDDTLRTMQNCQLGQHVPLEKDIGADGILLVSGNHCTSANDTDDANTSTRHGRTGSQRIIKWFNCILTGAPVGLTDLSKFCKKVLSEFIMHIHVQSTQQCQTVEVMAWLKPIEILFKAYCVGGSKCCKVLLLADQGEDNTQDTSITWPILRHEPCHGS